MDPYFDTPLTLNIVAHPFKAKRQWQNNTHCTNWTGMASETRQWVHGVDLASNYPNLSPINHACSLIHEGSTSWLKRSADNVLVPDTTTRVHASMAQICFGGTRETYTIVGRWFLLLWLIDTHNIYLTKGGGVSSMVGKDWWYLKPQENQSFKSTNHAHARPCSGCTENVPLQLPIKNDSRRRWICVNLGMDFFWGLMAWKRGIIWDWRGFGFFWDYSLPLDHESRRGSWRHGQVGHQTTVAQKAFKKIWVTLLWV